MKQTKKELNDEYQNGLLNIYRAIKPYLELDNINYILKDLKRQKEVLERYGK